MSRIGKKEIKIPAGLEYKVGEQSVTIKGPKGQLISPLMPGITMAVENGVIQLSRKDDTKQQKAYHGLCRSLLANAVNGVTSGFKKELEIVGVGYRAAVKGDSLELALGYSHPVVFPIPKGITISVEKNVNLSVEGIDKQQVGQVAANIRRLRQPEPYKGKGIKYKNEFIIRKTGKATGK